MVQPLRILVADPSPGTASYIRQTVAPVKAADVVSVTTAADARRRLSATDLFYDLAFIDMDIADSGGAALVRWIRADDDSPRPNLPVVLMSDSAEPAVTAAAVEAGTRLFLRKPFTQGRVLAIVDHLRSAYVNFLVSPTYIGPDRRATKRPVTVERRLAGSGMTQIVEDPSSYKSGDDAIVTVFDYTRLSLAEADLSRFRDFLTREHLKQAVANLARVREQVVSKVIQQHKNLETQHAALREGGSGDELKAMHSTATDITLRTTAAGFTLISAIAGSLRHYASGAYRISARLIQFLGSHIAAIRSALVHRVFDTGGTVGQSIVSAVRKAEHVFRRATADSPART